MEKKATPLSWQMDIIDNRKRANIDNDVILFDNFTNISSPIFNYPFKLDRLFMLFCTKGTGSGTIDFKPYSLSAPFVTIILPHQILHYEHISEDFTGYCLVVSNRFAPEMLPGIDKQLSMVTAITEKPYAQLDPESLSVVRKYFLMIKKIMTMTGNPYRLEMIKHLTQMFFYMAYTYFPKHIETTVQTRQGLLTEQFTKLVRENYRHERETAFYAGKLNLTPKYLSQAIKSATGKSASGWIEDFVILEAKALLKSTNMTVQQIGNELNFPSQSFFGKYFRRKTGMSPSDYKKM
ncbi:MAG: AraC family transcriptional regulator [Dysgonamonadaceae bacterium]|jgi:AraC-like DNA-binding protein|nr:AraC family transcriptional regulator [Dysgonamonadaceae bacterium]